MLLKTAFVDHLQTRSSPTTLGIKSGVRDSGHDRSTASYVL